MSTQQTTRCDVCGRREGNRTTNRFGGPDMNPDTPLGPVTKCPACESMACPDCLHEQECCEMVEEAESEEQETA